MTVLGHWYQLYYELSTPLYHCTSHSLNLLHTVAPVILIETAKSLLTIMSWFGSDPVAELEAKIDEATSESIPNGELDIAVGLEVTDLIRSKNVPPKQAMRSLKKRLTKVHANPNLLGSTLKLIDLCVKNCGTHFLVEINLKEFVDYLVDYIFKVHYNVKVYTVYSLEAKFSIGNQILKLVKEWTLLFKHQFEMNYLDKVYSLLLKQGYDFPEVDMLVTGAASNFVDSEAPPDWIDGKECMMCYTPFSVMNRKHHCRACGSVFCQTHSGHNIPLVSLGIMQPVRVCDDCYQIHKSKNAEATPATRGLPEPRGDDDDDELRRAIQASLNDTQISGTRVTPVVPTVPQVSAPEEEMDDDLKAAIAASLQDYNPVEQYQPPEHAPPQKQPEPELDFYQNILPFDQNAYSEPQYQTPYQAQYQQPQQTQPQPQQDTQRFAQQTMTPQQHIEQHKHYEELSTQDEEDINLFIQLMNGIKNDRSKQGNILYDQNLSELHSKVVQLKPKLNRALRTAIEKYELFLEMNNKVSTITRLYDQFLEAKLNQAYNKHYISPQYGVQYGQNTGVQQNATGVQGGARYAGGLPQSPELPRVTGLPHITGQQLQAAGQQSRRQSGSFTQQHTGYGQSAIPYPVEAPGAYQANTYSENQKYTPAQQFPSQPDEEKYSVQTHAPRKVLVTGYPSEPPFADTKSLAEQTYSTFTEGYSGDIPAYPSQPDYGSESEEQEAPVRSQFTGEYPTEPSYPEEDESDAESVASRYPPLEESAYQSEPTTSKEHASMRYPTIDQIEHDLSELPSMPDTLTRLDTSESKKYRAEPEPLIEL